MEEFKFKKNDNIGCADAIEDTEFLKNCFFDNGDLDVLKDCSNPKRILLGRTGYGKTALIEKLLEDTTKNVIRINPELLALSYISNSTILQYFDSLGVTLEPFFKLLWKHVLSIEIFKNHPKCNAEKTKGLFDKLKELFNRKSDQNRNINKAIDYLRDWGDSYWLESEARVKELTTKMEQKLEEGAKGILKVKGVECSLSSNQIDNLTEDTKIEVVHKCQKIVSSAQVKELNTLIDLLNGVLDDKQNPYYIVIDNLDTNWVEEKFRYKLIFSLILVTREFNRINNAKLIIALRRDLLEKVFQSACRSGFQEEKYEALYLPIEWSKSDILAILNQRVNYLVKRKYTKKPLTYIDLLPDKYGNTGIKTFLFSIANTPREIIQLFNFCISFSKDNPTISKANFKKAINSYSNLRYKALRDEWKDNYPSLIRLANVLLKQKPPSFKLENVSAEDTLNSIIEVVEKHRENEGELEYLCHSMNRNPDIPQSKFLFKVFYTFFKVGLIGIKLSESQGFSYINECGDIYSENEISLKTNIKIHPKYHNILGVHKTREIN